MPLTLEPDCQAALDLAKRAVPEGQALDAGLLLAALYNTSEIHDRFARLAGFLPAPEPRRPSAPPRVPLAPDVQPVFQQFADSGDPVSAEDLFEALLASAAGRAALLGRGATEEGLSGILAEAGLSPPGPAGMEPGRSGGSGPPPRPPDEWRSSPARQEAIRSLSSYGRMLTDTEPPHGHVVEREDALRALIRTLSKMKRRNAILVGPAGSGKSAIVYELARRLFRRDESLPCRLRNMDIFELSPTFLRSGTSMVGEYEKRVKELLQALQEHPQIMLFVDEIHSMFQSSLYGRNAFSDANEEFKAALGRGEITCIGCTTSAEYRHYIEPDRALERRFGIIRVEPPSREATLAILRDRRRRMEDYFAPLAIPETLLETVAALTDDYLPGRCQPDKSIQLLDEACAFCATASPPAPAVTEEFLRQALEDMIGHSIVVRGALSEAEVFDRLRAHILGQDEVLRQIARAFVAGFGDWSKRSGPRGVFVFGGPTGTGKTETAVALASIMGGDRESLVRVDCNTLQGSALDPGPSINRLLGVPPGYVGYARGQGGILSRIRDLPESIVLFDEFEKAGPGAGRLLLQIIDEGKVEDVDGNVLDFRRSFVIFTTNAGCSRPGPPLGFKAPVDTATGAAADLEAIKRELREIGLGDEFFARITHTMMFRALGGDVIRSILEGRLEALRRTSTLKGLELNWDARLVDHLAAFWQPQLGVRFAASILRNRISEQLDIAEAQGEMKGVKRIRLEVLGRGGAEAIGQAVRRRDADCLVIALS